MFGDNEKGMRPSGRGRKRGSRRHIVILNQVRSEAKMHVRMLTGRLREQQRRLTPLELEALPVFDHTE
jgi:hypothetical protein